MIVNGLLVSFVILTSESVSYTWSTNINSMITSRSVIPTKNDPRAKVLDSVASGIKIAMDQCKIAFKWNRWNCPDSAFSQKFVHPMSKEMAFVKAIVAAGVVHTITRNCSRGDLPSCRCDDHPDALHFAKHNDGSLQDVETDWSWGGCSDNTRYAEKTARKFLESPEQGNEARTYFHEHNSSVGRKIIRHTMERRCRCHGTSGSCTVQTCWMQVASFAEIAMVLKKRYNTALYKNFENNHDNLFESNSPTAFISQKLPKISSEKLVYLDESPNYCKADLRRGLPGTRGRECVKARAANATLEERKSCKNLCRSCGYKAKRHTRQMTFQCNCTFVWCCKVSCQTCTETVDEFICH